MWGRKKQVVDEKVMEREKKMHPLARYKGMGRGGKILTLLLVAIGLVLVMRGCNAIINKQAPEEKIARVIEVQQVELRSKDEVLQYTGGLAAGEQAIVNAKNGGRVSKILVENGATVSAGQALVLLESSDLQNMATINRATATKAQAAYQNALANYERYQALFEAGGMSQKDFDDIRLGLIVAEADASSAQAAAANAGEAIANATIKAPITGLVANREVTLGQMLAPGQQIMTVESTGQVAVHINISQNDINKLAVGMEADIEISSLSKAPFHGRLVSINPAADPSTRSFAGKVLVDNPEGKLKPGMYSRVKIGTGQTKKVLTVPVVAVTGEDGLYFVFLVEGDTVKRQRVDVGDVLGNMIEITKGLEEGQTVAITGASTLKDGDLISVKE
jgi:RND family efflux transporter MFP subunit